MKRQAFIVAVNMVGQYLHTSPFIRVERLTHIDTPTTAAASIATTLHAAAGNKIHVLSIHLPHHATLEQTHQLTQEWQDSHPQLQRHPCIIGADWNETFNTTNQAATTARGETILVWLSQHRQYLPQQCDNIPSYHPYNTTMRSRRLDYVSTSRKVLTQVQPVPESKNLASSDHEAVIATLTTKAANDQAQHKLTHHPMKIKALGAKIPSPPPAAHPWDSLTALAMQVTEAYPKQRFQESNQLRQHRHKLVTAQIPHGQQRQHWKLIQAAHKREKKRWDHTQAIKAGIGKHTDKACRSHSRCSGDTNSSLARIGKHTWWPTSKASLANNQANKSTRKSTLCARCWSNTASRRHIN